MVLTTPSAASAADPGILGLPAAKEEQEAAGAHTQAARFYLPELDLLRLGAFLMVWTAHASFVFDTLLPPSLLRLVNSVGSLGVPVFFFLSAYLITELLQRERASTGSVRLRAFYLRRMLRIWPLYFGVLLAYALLGLRMHAFHIETGRLFASLLLGGNWYLALHPGLTTPLRHLWSVSVEEQWYLLWPLAARALPRTMLLGLCGVIFAAAFAALAVVCAHASPHAASCAWLNSGVQFQFFAIGAATSLLLSGRIPQMPLSARAGLAALGMAAMVTAAGVYDMKHASGAGMLRSLTHAYLLAGAGTLSLFLAVLGAGGAHCPRVLVRLGQLSFGLYVFHETAFFFADEAMRCLGVTGTLASAIAARLLSLCLAVCMAWLSYRYWERPFLHMKKRWTTVQTREA